MKAIKNISLWVMAVLLLTAVSAQGNAQVISKTYFNIDWQFNAPVGNDYANVASGWGMNFEGGYYVIPKMAVGAFVSFHTNNKYIDRQTLQLSDKSALTTDQQHSIFQLPFGVLAKYRFTTARVCEPFVTLKMGANYSRTSSYLQAWELYHDSWGFIISPEIGMSLYPNPSMKYGFHMALYYNYSTNNSKVLSYKVDGLNNIGFRVGVSF